MVALNIAQLEAPHHRVNFAASDARLATRNAADLVWALHRTIISPKIEARAAKRAKAQLLRVISTPDESLATIVPPLSARCGSKRAGSPRADVGDLRPQPLFSRQRGRSRLATYE